MGGVIDKFTEIGNKIKDSVVSTLSNMGSKFATMAKDLWEGNIKALGTIALEIGAEGMWFATTLAWTVLKGIVPIDDIFNVIFGKVKDYALDLAKETIKGFNFVVQVQEKV